MKTSCMRCDKEVEVTVIEKYEFLTSICIIAKCKECKLVFSIVRDKRPV